MKFRKILSLGALEYLGIFFLSRLLLLFALNYFVQGHEFSDDVDVFSSLATNPLQILQGTSPVQFGSYAPLEGFLQAFILLPIRTVFGNFLSPRLMFIFFELVLGYFFFLATERVLQSPEQKKTARICLLVAPVTWMTSTVMVQDEVIAALFLTLSFYFLASDKKGGALFFCGLGVAVGKVFLILPLVTLILLVDWRNLITRFLVGSSVCVPLYFAQWAIALKNRSPLALVDFAPTASFGVTAWAWFFSKDAKLSFDESFAAWAKNVSLFLSFGLLIAIFFFLAWRRYANKIHFSSREVIRWSVVGLFVFFGFFYMVNPEYYMIAFVPLLFVLNRRLQFYTMSVLLSVPWLTNFFYGLKNCAWASLSTEGCAPGKMFFLNLYTKFSSLDPLTIRNATLFLNTLTTIGIAVWLACGLTESPMLSKRDPLI